MGFRTIISILMIILTGVVVAMNACSNIKLQGVIINPKTVSVRIKNYCPHTGVDTKNNPVTYTFADIYALNASSASLPTGFAPSLARDGLGDQFKTDPSNQSKYNLSYRKADTNNDGFSDLIMVYLGIITSSQPTLPYCDRSQSPFPDYDGDGLNDCEEALIGTDPKLADTDNDGIPDYLEVRFGMNPTNSADAIQSPDGDGISNLEKVKMNLPIGQFADDSFKARALKYTIQNLGTKNSPSCFDLKVSNIPIMTWNVPVDATLSINQLRFYITETAPGQPMAMHWAKVLISSTIEDKSSFLLNGQTQMDSVIGDGTSIPLYKDDGS